MFTNSLILAWWKTNWVAFWNLSKVALRNGTSVLLIIRPMLNAWLVTGAESTECFVNAAALVALRHGHQSVEVAVLCDGRVGHPAVHPGIRR